MNPKRIAQVAAVCCSVSLLAGYVVYAQRRVNPPAQPVVAKQEVANVAVEEPAQKPPETRRISTMLAPSSKLMIRVVPKEALTLSEPEKEEIVDLPLPKIETIQSTKKPETFIFSTKSGPVFPAHETTVQGNDPKRGFPVVPAEEKRMQPPKADPSEAKAPTAQPATPAPSPARPANVPRSTFAPGSKSIDMLLFSGQVEAPKAPTPPSAPNPPTPQEAPAAPPRTTFAPGSKSIGMPIFSTGKQEKNPQPPQQQPQQAQPKGGKQP